MKTASVLTCVLLSSCTHRSEVVVADLYAVLTTGKWVKDLGSGPWSEAYVYAFAKDGTYTSKLITDHTTPTVTGRWELAKGENGKVHLRLKDQKERESYYWLYEDSVVRYDKEEDALVVSGERYAGEPRLRHEKP